MRLLLYALSGTQAYRHLYYGAGLPGETEARATHDFELDALLIHDTALLLVEAKAGTLTPPARRGSPERLERDLRALVREAHDQAIRAADFLEEGEIASFNLKDGKELQVARRDFSRLFLISVTLEPLGHLTSLLHAAPVYAAESPRIVWTVSLYDLIVIAEISEPFWGLLHYLERRVRAAAQRLVEAHDELDFFGFYLDSGLYFEPSEIDHIKIGTFTDPIDAYYLQQAGLRKKMAPKPRPRMSPEFSRFMAGLVACKLPGRLDMLLTIADLDGESRREWVRRVVEVKRRYRHDRRAHNFSMSGPSDGGWGLTYMCGPEEVDALEHLEGYCRRKAREVGVKIWCGIYDADPRTYRFFGLVNVRN